MSSASVRLAGVVRRVLRRQRADRTSGRTPFAPDPPVPPRRFPPSGSGKLIGALSLSLCLLLAGCGAQPSNGTPLPRAERAAAQATTVTVLAVGDIACPPEDAPSRVTCRHQDTADLANSLQPEAVLALGDLQYQTGSLAAFRGSYDKSWGSLKPITYPVPGNHEYRTANAEGYYQYFAGQPGGAAPGYYAAQLGDWRAYLLNTNCTKVDCAAQRDWLRTQLTSRPAQCTLFAMHHPRFSSGEHGPQLFTRSFTRIGYRHGLDLVLAGHDHHYERFVRMDPDGRRDTSRGFFQFVSGAGGKSHYDADPPRAGSAYRNDTAFGVLRLQLSPGSFRYAFKTIDGRTPDAGVRSCA